MAIIRPISIEARPSEVRSQGALAVVENVLAAETAGPPLHVSPSLDETFYMLEGTADFQVGEATFTALQGASVFVPRGTPHTYANPRSQRARLLLVCTPGTTDATGHYSRIVGEPLAA